MGLKTKIEKIHEYATNDRVAFKKHAVLRMHQRKILADDAKKMLESCELIEDYPNDYPLPSGLFLGFSEHGKPLHAVVALDEDAEILWVITLYEPTLAQWKDGYKERRTTDEMPAM